MSHIQRLLVWVQRPGHNDRQLSIETTEKITPCVIQHLVAAALSIDPDCVSMPPYEMPTTVGEEHPNCFRYKVVLKRATAASTCPPSRLMDTNGVWQRYFPDNSRCWGCKAYMSEDEYKTKALPLLCGHTHCEQCAMDVIHRKIEGNEAAALNRVVCKYCLKQTLYSTEWSREDILTQGLDENPFGCFNVEQSCSNLLAHHEHRNALHFCRVHNELVCTACAPTRICRLIECDHPDAQMSLHRFVNQKAYDLDRQHDQIIKCFLFIRKHKTFFGAAYDFFLRLLVDYCRDQCVRVLQLRADAFRLGLSPCEAVTPVRITKSSRNGFPYLLIDAFHQAGALRKRGLRPLSWKCVSPLSFKAMRRQLHSSSLGYLGVLSAAGFLGTAQSATITLEPHLWRCALPQLMQLKAWGVDFNAVNRHGRTAAHSAACRGDAERLLALRDGTNLKKKDTRGLMAAHYAAMHDHAQCLEVLPATCLKERDAHGWTPAHHAASNGSVRAIALLLRRGISIHGVATPQGDLPVHLATRRGHINVLKLFYGVNSLSNENDGTTAIHIAAGGRLDCLTWLHEHGCQIDAPVGDGTQRTALHIAAQRGAPVCLEYLLRHANDARDARTDDGKTAAHFAAECGNVACLSALRDAGASMTLTDARGRKPIHYAAQNGWLVCLEVLRDLQHSYADVEEALRIATAQNLLKCVEWLRSWVEALRHAASLTHRAPTVPLSVGRRCDTSSAASTSSSVRTHAFHLPTPRQAPTYNLAAGWVGSGDPVIDDFLQQFAVQEALRAAAV